MDDGDIDPKQKREFFRRLKQRALLAEWYGPAYASREISAYGGKPRPVGDFLGDVTRQVFSDETRYQVQLAEEWPAVVGPEISAMSRVSKLENGILTLEIRHSAYRKELEHVFDLIRTLTNRYLGGDLCREIRLEAANRRHRKFGKS